MGFFSFFPFSQFFLLLLKAAESREKLAISFNFFFKVQLNYQKDPSIVCERDREKMEGERDKERSSAEENCRNPPSCSGCASAVVECIPLAVF